MNPKMGFVAFLYGVFVCLTAMVKGLFLPVALGRGAFSSLVLFIVLILFHLGWKTYPSKEERKGDALTDPPKTRSADRI